MSGSCRVLEVHTNMTCCSKLVYTTEYFSGQREGSLGSQMKALKGWFKQFITEKQQHFFLPPSVSGHADSFGLIHKEVWRFRSMNLVLSPNCNRGDFICAAESTEELPSSVSFKNTALDTLDKPLKLSLNSFHSTNFCGKKKLHWKLVSRSAQ